MPWPGPEFMKTANMSQQKENKDLFQPLFSKRPSTMHKNTRSKCRQVWTLQSQRGRGRAFENQTGPIKTWPGRLWEKPPESAPGRTMSFLVWLLQGHNGCYSLNTCGRWSDSAVSQISALEYWVLIEVEKWTKTETEKEGGIQRRAVPRNSQCRDVNSKATFQLFSGHYDMLYHMHWENQNFKQLIQSYWCTTQ